MMLGDQRQAILDSLQELADLNIQRQLWLSDGSGGKHVSSFSEAVEQLFTDTGLANSLHSGGTGLGPQVDRLLTSLELMIRKVEMRNDPKVTIEDRGMSEIRSTAKKLYDLLAQ